MPKSTQVTQVPVLQMSHFKDAPFYSVLPGVSVPLRPPNLCWRAEVFLCQQQAGADVGTDAQQHPEAAQRA